MNHNLRRFERNMPWKFPGDLSGFAFSRRLDKCSIYLLSDNLPHIVEINDISSWSWRNLPHIVEISEILRILILFDFEWLKIGTSISYFHHEGLIMNSVCLN